MRRRRQTLRHRRPRRPERQEVSRGLHSRAECLETHGGNDELPTQCRHGFFDHLIAQSCDNYHSGVVSLYHNVYAVGGDDGTSNLSSVEVYNAVENHWSRLPVDMPLARSYAGLAVIGKNGA